MANDEFREGHEESRAHGLKARHETREARAVRKQVAEEIALAIEAIEYRVEDVLLHPIAIRVVACRVAREIGSRDPATSEAKP